MTKLRRKVLYVEDSAENRRLVRLVLENEGYEVVEIDDGAAAVEGARRHAPDLILMDMHLPNLDGYEITRRIRQLPEFAAVPIVALTASVLKADKDQALRAGCTGFIQKPIDVDRFPRQLNEFFPDVQSS